MKYTDAQIEEAARILCEKRGLHPLCAAYVKGCIEGFIAWSDDIESALRQAVGSKSYAN